VVEVLGADLSSIVQSKLFIFRVGTGEEKDAIQTYSEAIAATSDKMRALIDGGMKESGTHCAELHDVETEDFIRYYEYALRGDYTVPPYKVDKTTNKAALIGANESAIPADWEMSKEVPEPPPALQAELVIEEDPWEIRPSVKKKKKGILEASFDKTEKDKKSLRKQFDNRDYLVRAGEPNGGAFFGVGHHSSSNTNAKQDFTPVFLAHARLYTFADFNLVAPLKALALHKLHHTLVSFRLYHARIGDVIELAKYAYNNNHNRKEDGTVDSLRELVVEYIAREIDFIGKSQEWEELIEEGGEFMVDFWRVAREYRILA
jgi:hypothetical protein